MSMFYVKQVYQRKKPMSSSAQSFTQSAFRLSNPPRRTRPLQVGPALLATLAAWRARQRTRRHLGALNDRELADVGLSRKQQRDECAKPFWLP